jgi:hypothetical protein
MMTTRAFLVAGAAVAAFAGAAFADVSAQFLLYPFNSNNPVGTGWTQSMAPNDDGSTGQLALGFDFCFYQQNRNSLYINNNGNVSFNAPFFNFTSTGFPVAGFDMIAPFWADVDTRNQTNANTNLVWHQTFGTPGHRVFVVTWDAVGWYNQAATPTNTFQVAMAENVNQFGVGLNCAFSYGDMNWTTGTASGGGPFGGTPATVGINNGNGVDFDQIGRYDHAGYDYNGSSNAVTNGVDSLDLRTYYFDACHGILPAPGATALLGLGGLLAARRRR